MSTKAALRYARAILNLAIEKSTENLLKDSMLCIAKTIQNNKSLSVVLNSPIIKSSKKKDILLSIFKDVDEISKKVFHLLSEKNRLLLLEDIAKKYIILYEHYKCINVAQVFTAVALNEELEQKIKTKIREITGKEAIIENKIDPSIIGGFIFRIGDVQYDDSIANKLKNITGKNFDTNHYNPNNSFIPKL